MIGLQPSSSMFYGAIGGYWAIFCHAGRVCSGRENTFEILCHGRELNLGHGEDRHWDSFIFPLSYHDWFPHTSLMLPTHGISPEHDLYRRWCSHWEWSHQPSFRVCTSLKTLVSVVKWPPTRITLSSLPRRWNLPVYGSLSTMQHWKTAVYISYQDLIKQVRSWDDFINEGNIRIAQ